MFRYSIFVKSPEEETFGIDNIEIDKSYFGKPLEAMSPAETEDAREKLIYNRLRIVLYTTALPLYETDNYIKLFRTAHLLGVEYIRLCPALYKNGADVQKLAPIEDMARGMGIPILFEPTAETPGFDFDKYLEISTGATGIIINPSEYVRQGKMPFRSVFYKSKSRIKADTRFIRVSDAVMGTGEAVPLEEGNSEIKECISVMRVRNYQGYLSLSDYGVPVAETLPRLAKLLTEL